MAWSFYDAVGNLRTTDPAGRGVVYSSTPPDRKDVIWVDTSGADDRYPGGFDVWNTIAEGRTFHGGSTGSQWFTGNGPVPNGSNMYSLDVPLFSFDPADYSVPGKTTQARVVLSVVGNATAGSPATVVGFITAVASSSGTGAASNLVMGGFTVATPAVVMQAGPNAPVKGAPVDASTIPAGVYGFALFGAGSFTAGAAVMLGIQLQIRHVRL